MKKVNDILKVVGTGFMLGLGFNLALLMMMLLYIILIQK